MVSSVAQYCCCYHLVKQLVLVIQRDDFNVIPVRGYIDRFRVASIDYGGNMQFQGLID
jgi:hypothetical protein